MDFGNQTGCKIHIDEGLKVWSINPEKIQELYPLLHENIEIGGKFIIDGKTTQTQLDNYKTNKGQSDSVQAPEAIVNFHTHPISCYKGEDTVFGWFSGEDVRETVLFSMKGSVAHLVISVEGVYILQVNPCILSNLISMDGIESVLNEIYSNKKAHKKLTEIVSKTIGKDSKSLENIKDIFRGIIIVSIEVYFRSTHRFRSYDINSDNYLFPSDYISFVNSFQLSNIYNHKKKVKGCGNLKCNGIPVYERKKQFQRKFNKYLHNYENGTKLYLVTKEGHIYPSKINLSSCKELFPYIEKLVDKSKSECKQLHYPSDHPFEWGDNWFHMSLYPNEVEYDGKYYIYSSDELTGEDRKNILNSKPELYLTEVPEFYYFDISGNCNHNHTTKLIQKTHKIEKNGNKKITDIVIVGSLQCPYTVKIDRLFKENGIPFTERYLDSIKDAVKLIQTKYPEINTIPALFVVHVDGDMEYIGGYDSAETFLKNLIVR